MPRARPTPRKPPSAAPRRRRRAPRGPARIEQGSKNVGKRACTVALNLDDEPRSSTIVLVDEPCSEEQQPNTSEDGSIAPQMQPRYRNLRPRKRPVEYVSCNDKKRHRAAGLKLADVPCSQTQCPSMRKKDAVVPRMQVKLHNTRSRKRTLETEPLGVKKRSCPALKRSTIRVTPTVIETDAYFAMDIAAPIGTT